MTDCRLTLVAEHESGQHTYTCPRCHVSHHSRYPPALIHRTCETARKCDSGGPGTELARILKRLGVRVKRGCGCGDWVRWMNALGPDGCRENMPAIVGRLKEQARWAPRWAIRWLVRWAIRRSRGVGDLNRHVEIDAALHNRLVE